MSVVETGPAIRRSAAPTEPAAIITDLYDGLTVRGMSLVDVTWEQHRLHESRRWSVVDMLAGIDLDRLTRVDRIMVWNAGRAELTAKPAADRMERLADAECRRWQDTNPTVSAIMQACGTWSRYWNEEESHHETVFIQLANLTGMDPITDETFVEFRQVHPDDDMLRILVIAAISEIMAAVNYGQCQLLAEDPGLRRLFKQVAADEIQHRNYFVSFAKALVDSGEYYAKDAFVVGHLFLREGGEVLGSARDQVEVRDNYVNWWDQIEFGEGDFRHATAQKTEQLVCGALRKITGIEVRSRDEVEDTWMELVGG